MSQTFPPGHTAASLRAGLAAMAKIVGDAHVYTQPEHLAGFRDPYSLDAEAFVPSAAVAPASVQEVQALVKVANEHKLPLWVVSCGRNYCYGGAAPCLTGAIVLDLKRMKKIEVNEELAYAIVEPGVTYFDLYNHLQATGSSLWIDCAAPGWGSVMGNALDYGVGYTPYADHAGFQCGMEVVLPNGDLMRTGMGGIDGNPAWGAYKHSFGPSLDGLFKQSNFGVVTKMGIWLMRAPEMFISVNVTVPGDEDCIPLVDISRELRLAGHIQGAVTAGNWMRTICSRTTHGAWAEGSDKPLNEAQITKLVDHYKIGRWNATFGLYGGAEVTPLHLKAVEAAYARIPGAKVTHTVYKRGEKIGLADTLSAGVPNLLCFTTLDWRGGSGAHIEFCPVLPMHGETFYKRYRRSLGLFTEYGFDCFSGVLSTTERAAANTGSIIFDRGNAEQVKRAEALFNALVKSTEEDRLGVYRTHISFMDSVAKTFDFNNGATMRAYQQLKDALDPNGILSPGKSGIWPRHLRKARG
jgi:4-cresol dehydrogenase (hydroxylating)